MGRFESIGAIQPFLKLQEGDWADVFKAYDTSLERNVLLKKLKSEFQSDRQIARRFEDEARLMARVKHPNVVSVLSSGRSDDIVYFVAEFVEGRSLDELVSTGNLPVLLSLYILREVASGLEAAHAQQIFHRDIKPSNILLSAEGTVKLTDFGMASIMEDTQSEALRGTLGYVAPELVLEGEPGVASDLFSLGATFYEMLAGQPAFVGATSTEVFDQLLHHDPLPVLAANPNINPAVLTLCRKLMEKNPDARYAGCRDVIDEVDEILAHAASFDGAGALLRFLDDPENYEEALLAPAVLQETSIPQEAPPAKRNYRNARRWALASLSVAAIAILIAVATGRPDADQVLQGESTLSAPGASLAMDDSLSTPVETGVDVSTLIDSSSVSSRPALQDEEALQTETVTSDPVVAPPEIAPARSEDSDGTADTLATAPSVQTGELHVLCTPFCEIHIDGEMIGEAPPSLTMSLPAGVHELVMVNPNLPDYASDIVVQAGQSDSIEVALLDQVGIVELKIHPWADVYIDGVHHGVVPPTQSFILKPGPHSLRLEHSVLGVWETRLLVAAGEKQLQSFNLKELLN